MVGQTSPSLLDRYQVPQVVRSIPFNKLVFTFYVKSTEEFMMMYTVCTGI